MKKQERCTVERVQQTRVPVLVYRLSCGDLFEWADIFPPIYNKWLVTPEELERQVGFHSSTQDDA